MTEREFYISVIPKLAELIVLLKDVAPEEKEEIKQETLNNCKDRPQVLKIMGKCWMVIDTQLQEMHAN